MEHEPRKFIEFLKGILVEESGFLIDERCLAQDGMGAFCEDGLQFGIAHCKAEALGFVGNDLVVHIVLPDLVSEEGGLFVSEVGTLGEFYYVGVFFYHLLVFECGELFSIDFADFG